MKTITKVRLIKVISGVLIALGLGVYFLADSVEQDLIILDKQQLDSGVMLK